MRLRSSAWQVVLLSVVVAGCTGPILRHPSPEPEPIPESGVTLVEDLARPFGMKLLKVEAVGLVMGLDGTGSDPPPSPQRAMLLDEMKRRKVEEPGKALASPNTAMVLVRAILRPGVQKGEKIDLEVACPSRSETQSLRGAWLMPTRLTETAILDRQIHTGHVLAMGKGPILVDPSAHGEEDRALLTHGRILGGGVVRKARPLGLSIIGQDASESIGRRVGVAVKIGSAINQRFYTYHDGGKKGVANPKTDEYLELIIHPRYQENVSRYIRVIRNIALSENSIERRQRLELLEHQLLDPATAAIAAIRLEAIGTEAIEVLRRGMAAADPEVRFYSAEALAYLDAEDAVTPLVEAARDEPAFRVYALTALSAMDNLAAQQGLHELLSVRSAETRYGAFRALSEMSSRDPLVVGENLGGRFSFHRLAVGGPPMIHATRSHRPELVMFGADQPFKLPMTLSAGKYIMVTGRLDSGVTVGRFAPNEPEQSRTVDNSVEGVIRAVVELDGSYPDVVQALEQAKEAGALESRLEFDALPEGNRSYDRKPAEEESGSGDEAEHAEAEGRESDSQVENGAQGKDGEDRNSGLWGVPNPLSGLMFRQTR